MQTVLLRIDAVTHEGNISPLLSLLQKDLTESNGVLEVYKSQVSKVTK